MPWLYQDYVGHDNNRDGYMLNMIESQVVTRTEIEYSPVIFYCQHQTAPFPARIWIPPFADPISSNISPYMRSWLNVVGTKCPPLFSSSIFPEPSHRPNTITGIPASSTSLTSSGMRFRSSPRRLSTAMPRRASIPSMSSPSRRRT